VPARESGHRRVPAPPAGTTAHSPSNASAVMARILPSQKSASATNLTQVVTPRTFPALVGKRLQTDPGQPLITAYDDATGERTELSVTTYANWVSKTANLLTDELGLEAGDTMLLDLPPHWLVPVFLGAAWCAGVAVTVTPHVHVRHDLVVCGPETMPEHAAAGEVVACSLLPLAVRFVEPLPDGVLDFGLLWPAQSDVFIGLGPPSPDSVAWLTVERPRTQSELIEAAVALRQEAGVRLLTDLHPASQAGVPAFLGPLVSGGSVVYLRNAADASWSARGVEERITAELRDAAQPPRA
jgi:uncharacterized protein (TIGR03089 family)